MNQHVFAPIHLLLVVLACVLFFVAATGWFAPVEPHRTKLIAAGLFCWALSQFF